LVEHLSPWSLDDCKKIFFLSLPHTAPEAVAKLRPLIGQIARTLGNSPA
jgi:hypothetical protein